jgi:Spy/CpxP family protein refolding chaperone
MSRIALIAAGLAVAAWPAVRAADSAPPPATENNNIAPPPPGAPHGGGRNRLQHLTEVLDLTPAQQDQVAAIYQAAGPQRQAIMNEPLSEADRRAQLHALKKDTQAKLRALLTPDQQKKFDAMPHPRRDGWRPKAGEGPDAPPPGGGPAAPAGAP